MTASPVSAQHPDGFAFIAALQGRPATDWVRNAPVAVTSVSVGSAVLPVTVTTPSPVADLSWVVSLRAAYGPYALSELDTLPLASARPLLAGLIRGLDRLLVAAELDRLLCINNWLLSTNLHPPMTDGDLTRAAQNLSTAYPRHFVAVRSLNDHHHGSLLHDLRAAGWTLLPSRQVWIATPQDRPTRDRGNDARLLRRTPLTRCEGTAFDTADWEQTAALYAQLYLGKYSRLNPVFTPDFLRWAQGSGVMRVQGLRGGDGRLLAVVGTIAAHGVMTTPLIGYDLSAPRSLGLYRMATALAFEVMERRQASFNLSAGVGGFKRNRGARPAIEYTALWDRHLPWPRRLPVRLLAALLTGLGIPLMRRYAL